MYDKQYASVAWAVSFFLFLDRCYPLSTRIVQPPEGGTVQLRLHNIFLLFFDIWTLLIKISKGVALTCLGNFHKINFCMLISSRQTNILNISVSTCPICLIKVSRPMFSRSGNMLNTFTLLSG